MLQFLIDEVMKDENGYGSTTKPSFYRTDYLVRAIVGAVGLSARATQDAVCSRHG